MDSITGRQGTHGIPACRVGFPGFLTLLAVFLFHTVALAADELRISGATTLQPVMEQLAPAFTAKSGVAPRIQGGGSGKGIADVLEGTSDIGMVSRDLRGEEKEKMGHKLVAMDALCFIVNTTVPLRSLSKSQVQGLYGGRITNWRELGGPDLPVELISKELGRATLDLFEGYATMHHPERKEPGAAGYISKSAHEVGSNLEALTLVGGIPGAVGYVSYGSAAAVKAKGMGVTILATEGVEPGRQSIVGKTYPILRELNLVFLKPTKAIEALLSFLSGPEGTRAFEAQGFIPVN